MLRLKSRKWLLLVIGIVGISFLGLALGAPPQKNLQTGDTKEIHWMSFDEAVKLSAKHPKKIFIDVFTQWCGWCKKMDADTYTKPEVIDYINKYYYAVRLDAETADTFHFNDHKFFNAQPHTRGYVNELASSLLDGKLGYPTTVYMTEKFERLTYVQSYINAEELMPILRYFAEDKYKTMKFDDYKKSLGTAITSPSPAAVDK